MGKILSRWVCGLLWSKFVGVQSVRLNLRPQAGWVHTAKLPLLVLVDFVRCVGEFVPVHPPRTRAVEGDLVIITLLSPDTIS